MYKRVLQTIVVITVSLFITSCMVGIAEVSTMPMPKTIGFPDIAIPMPELPSSGTIIWMPTVTVPLPDEHIPLTYRDHAVERHAEDAEKARDMGEDPNTDCNWYQCTASKNPNSLLRICRESDSYLLAVQWTWLNVQTMQWTEGTSFLMNMDKLPNFMKNHGCRPAHQGMQLPMYTAVITT